MSEQRLHVYLDGRLVGVLSQSGSGDLRFTYDDESYADADLDAWLVAVGELLREQGEGETTSKSAAEASPAKPNAAL